MTRTRFFSTIIPTLSASQTATVKPKISQTNIYPHFRTAHTLRSPIQPVPTYFSSTPKVYVSPMSTSIAPTQRSLHTYLADPKVNMVKSLVKKIFLNPTDHEALLIALKTLLQGLNKPLVSCDFPYFLANNLNSIGLNSTDYSVLKVLLEHASHPDIAQFIQEDYFELKIACIKQEEKPNNHKVLTGILEKLADSGIVEEMLENTTIVFRNDSAQRKHSEIQSMKTIFKDLFNIEQEMLYAFSWNDIKGANKLCDKIEKCCGDLKSLKFAHLYESLNKYPRSLTSDQSIIQGDYEFRLGFNRNYNVYATPRCRS